MKDSNRFSFANFIGISALAALLFALAGCSNPVAELGQDGIAGIGSTSFSKAASKDIPRGITVDIYDVSDFLYFGSMAAIDPTTNGILQDDINLAGTIVVPIGTPRVPFVGIFDGQDYTLTVNISGTSSYIGVFGFNDGYIHNLRVEGTVTAAYDGSNEINYVGGVVAYNDIAGTISNVVSAVTVNAVNDNIRAIGGIAGFNGFDAYTPDSPHYNQTPFVTGGVIQYCRNEGAVTGGNSKIGGIAGENSWQITQCSNWGTITCIKTVDGWPGVGGIVGRNGNNNDPTETGAILYCYNWGDIYDQTTGSEGTGQNAYGGITGWNNLKSTVTSCYTIGQFDPERGQKNPIMGRVDGSIGGENNYSLDTIYAFNPTDRVLTGLREPDAFMQTQDFVTDLNRSPIGPYALKTGYAYPVLGWD